MENQVFKLIYFNIQGRAEVSRLLMALANAEYEDVRVSSEEWKKIKPTMPFGTIPVLVVDGKMFGQSKAIAVFLAREFGFYGKTNLDCLKIDQVVQLMEDFIQEYGKFFFFEKDEYKKKEGEEKLKKEIGPRYLSYFEKILKDNGGCYLVGNNMTLADITVFDMCNGFLGPIVEGSIGKFPLLKKLVDSVGSNERISAYMANRK